MSDAFWNVALVSELEKSNSNSPYLSTFYASQVKENDKGFLSTTITIRDMIQERGDVHHIFPKAYIKKTFNSFRKDSIKLQILYIHNQKLILVLKINLRLNMMEKF